MEAATTGAGFSGSGGRGELDGWWGDVGGAAVFLVWVVGVDGADWRWWGHELGFWDGRVFVAFCFQASGSGGGGAGVEVVVAG